MTRSSTPIRLRQILRGLRTWVRPEEHLVGDRNILRGFLAASELTRLKAAWAKTAETKTDPAEEIRVDLARWDEDARNQRRYQGLWQVAMLMVCVVALITLVTLSVRAHQGDPMTQSDYWVLTGPAMVIVGLLLVNVFQVKTASYQYHSWAWRTSYFSTEPGFFQDVRALMVFVGAKDYAELVDMDELRERARRELVAIVVSILNIEGDAEYHVLEGNALRERHGKLHNKLREEFDRLLRLALTGTSTRSYARLFEVAKTMMDTTTD